MKPRLGQVLRSAPLLLTLRERKGVALALDYLVRAYMPDPSDELHGGREYANLS